MADSTVPDDAQIRDLDQRRPSISRRLRFEILRRDNHRGRYCGSDDGPLQIDHVVPVSLGGSDDPSNLVASCIECNVGKASTSPNDDVVADVAEDAAKWARAIRIASSERMEESELEDALVAGFENCWNRWGYGPENARRRVPLPGGYRQSVLRFFRLGLTPLDLSSAVDIAMGKNGLPPNELFRYFCGICWNYVREVQDRAMEIVRSGRLDDSEIGVDEDEPF